MLAGYRLLPAEAIMSESPFHIVVATIIKHGATWSKPGMEFRLIGRKLMTRR